MSGHVGGTGVPPRHNGPHHSGTGTSQRCNDTVGRQLPPRQSDMVTVSDVDGGAGARSATTDGEDVGIECKVDLG